DSDDGPPECIAEVMDGRSAEVLLEGQFCGRAGDDDAEHGQEDKVQSAMSEDIPRTLEGVSENDAYTGQVQEPKQPQGSQWPERGQRHHRQIGEMVGDEPPA